MIDKFSWQLDRSRCPDLAYRCPSLSLSQHHSPPCWLYSQAGTGHRVALETSDLYSISLKSSGKRASLSCGFHHIWANIEPRWLESWHWLTHCVQEDGMCWLARLRSHTQPLSRRYHEPTWTTWLDCEGSVVLFKKIEAPLSEEVATDVGRGRTQNVHRLWSPDSLSRACPLCYSPSLNESSGSTLMKGRNGSMQMQEAIKCFTSVFSTLCS